MLPQANGVRAKVLTQKVLGFDIARQNLYPCVEYLPVGAYAMPTLVIATTNQNKLREYAAIFAGLPIELRSLRDVGIDDDVEETGATFAENAQLKAEFYAARSGLLTLADDSGLEVHALDGAPG